MEQKEDVMDTDRQTQWYRAKVVCYKQKGYCYQNIKKLLLED